MYKTNFFVAVFLLILFGFGACTSDKKIDKAAVKKEIESREIKKITDAEIVSKIHEMGNVIALKAKQTLGKNLKKAIEEGGVEYAISFCNLAAMPLVDSLSINYEAKIRRVSLKARNQNDLPSSIEKELLEAYEYQWKDSIPLQTNVQTMDEEHYLFTKPIFVDNALCLSCHGNLDNGFTQETDDFIKSKYPLDKATGYNMGDLRGMWSITISKKKVVQSF